MQILEFQNWLSKFPVFSLNDIRKVIPGFSYRQLDRWEKKGYLLKIRQGYYSFTNLEKDQNFLLYVANRIYTPSYVSLELAMKIYGFIPEEVFQITSVSSRKTRSFETSAGNFSYRHLKPGLFWGYQLLDFGRQKMLIAEPEKAVLDYLYLNPKLKKTEDFLEIRINGEEFRSRINIEKFNKYLEGFGNKALESRTSIFLKMVQNVGT